MNRSDRRLDVFVRALALAAAVGLTSLIVGVHAADLGTLGGHEVVTAASAPATVVASGEARPASVR